jgi:DMSO/TMAO reductase YedYZ molybdopterin-dependent catalytic subunit
VSTVVTMECAGNGRARLRPRPVSQPWLVEAVGTARWTGTPLAPLLREAGLRDEAVDVVFTGADHGIERGVEQDYQRSLTVAEAMHDDVLLAYEMNDAPLPPQHGHPLRLVRVGSRLNGGGQRRRRHHLACHRTRAGARPVRLGAMDLDLAGHLRRLRALRPRPRHQRA